MGNENGAIKARMFVGGLKSLFIDIAETLDEVEKTGSMPVDMLQSLLDIKTAIDMTLIQLSKTQMRCCEHAPECEHSDDEDDDGEFAEDEYDQGRVEDDIDSCEDCDEPEDECVCDEDEEPLLPPRKPTLVKKVESKVVTSARKKGR